MYINCTLENYICHIRFHLSFKATLCSFIIIVILRRFTRWLLPTAISSCSCPRPSSLNINNHFQSFLLSSPAPLCCQEQSSIFLFLSYYVPSSLPFPSGLYPKAFCFPLFWLEPLPALFTLSTHFILSIFIRTPTFLSVNSIPISPSHSPSFAFV